MSAMSPCMNIYERDILRRNHCLIVSNVDTKCIRPYLFEKGIVNDQLYLENDNVTTRRAEIFMKDAIEKCSFQFLVDLFFKHGYSFIANSLLTDFDCSHTIPRDRKEPIFDILWRPRTIHFRHTLKRLVHSGNMKKYAREKCNVEEAWKSVSHPFDFKNESREVADMFFMANDAELERLRVINDKDLNKSEVICREITAISAYTSSSTIPIAMQLARFGSASLVAGRVTVQQALKYIQDAKQKLSTVPACRETGVVLFIEYNMLTQLYEAEPLSTTREDLLQLGERVIVHFESEVTDKCMGSDFRRMVLLKLCHILLNIGLFHNYLDGNIVTEENMRKAEHILKEIEKPEYWNRMENRWLMFYYTAKSRICKLQFISGKALKHMIESEKYAVRCKYNKELNNIKKEIKVMKTENERDVSIHDVCSNINCILPTIDFPHAAW